MPTILIVALAITLYVFFILMIARVFRLKDSRVRRYEDQSKYRVKQWSEL